MANYYTIGIVAGEVSGDTLGAGLMTELVKRVPNVRFVGIGGPKMISQGLESWFSIEELSVMGLEILKKLPRILRIRKAVTKKMIASGVDLFIGIDAPDFNLTVEGNLHRKGIRTVHYVSPSVWAWRQNRVYKIKISVDEVLCLLPFEKEFYDRFNVPSVFVGHTLADYIPLETDPVIARRLLNIPEKGFYLAVLPGSRTGEVNNLSPVFLEACQKLVKVYSGLEFLVPMVNTQLQDMFTQFCKKHGKNLKIRVFRGNSRQVIAASDAVLLASGTATLETLLIGRPMVVCYKISKFSEFIARKLLKVNVVSLPNLLIPSHPVPELLQDDCTPEKISSAFSRLFGSDQSDLLKSFRDVHMQMMKNADEQAAEACVRHLVRK